VRIRDFEDADWPQVWQIVEEVVRAEETFPYDPDMTEQQARDTWVEKPPGRTTVATDDSRVLGQGRWVPIAPGPAPISRQPASWSPLMDAAAAWEPSYAGTRWPGQVSVAKRVCSSMPWSPRTTQRRASTSVWV
jgi:hypothetical protein